MPRGRYRYPIGPQMPDGARAFNSAIGGVSNAASYGSGITLVLDLQPAVNEMHAVLSRFSDNVKRIALYNALNHEGDMLRTAVRRDVAKSAGVPYGHVSRVIVAHRAHPNNLMYRLVATDKPFPLIAFAKGAKAGQKNPRAAPWGKSRAFKGAFVIRYRSGGLQIVKRVADRSGGRGSHKNNSGKIKMMYGPIVPREMIRPGNPSTQRLMRVIPERIIPRVIHELGQALARGHK